MADPIDLALHLSAEKFSVILVQNFPDLTMLTIRITQNYLLAEAAAEVGDVEPHCFFMLIYHFL